MSEKPSKPRRTALKRKTGTYQAPPIPLEGTQMPPPAPQPYQNATLPRQPQREKVVIVKQGGGNGVASILNIITWPFRKLAGAVVWLVRIIITAMIQSVVSFIMWTIILVLLSAFVGTYSVAMYDTNMNVIQALSLTFERIVLFFQALVNFRAADSIPTPMP